jgi:acetyl esterase/lipase
MRRLLALAALSALLLVSVVTAQVRYRDPVFTGSNVQAGIQYGSAVNRYSQRTEALLLDLYTPVGDTETRRPAVVVVHGGGFVSGSRGSSRFVAMCRDFARRGYVAATIDYRLAPSTQQRKLPESAEDAQEDTKAAVRWLRKNAVSLGVDTGKIAAIGSSAGGYAVVMASYYREEGKSGNAGFASTIQAVTDLWGGTFDVNEIEAGETPIVIVHGTNDSVVSFQNALDLQKQCGKVGIPVDWHPLTGLGHAPWTEYANLMRWSYDWYYRHLRLAQKNGLTARAGYRSPGTLTFDLVGPAGADAVLYLSFSPASIPFAPHGVIGLNPATLIPMAAMRLPATPGIAERPVTFAVPAGLSGYALHWQAILIDGAKIVSLTNPVKTAF